MAKCQHKRALELFSKVGVTVTPEQIDKHVGGTGSYYSKHMSVMRRWGFEFDVKKDGREIVSYTLTKEPANAAEYRTAKVSKAKAAKVVKTKANAAKKPAPIKEKVEAKKTEKPAKKPVVQVKDAKATNLEKLKAVAEKRKREKEELKETLKAKPSATSFTVDPDFDSVENIDISALI